MSTPTLDRHDRAVLASLADGPASLGALAGAVDRPRTDLRRRLDALAAGGLVRRREDGDYERTESGRRVLAASATGDDDERIDTPPRVETALHSLDLRPDEADAVRSAFAFLRFRRSATADEIVDATYDEAPAGRDDPRAWWTDCVRDRLASLPAVEPPDGDGHGDGDEGQGDRWRYVGGREGDVEGEGEEVADGRRVLGGSAGTDADPPDGPDGRDL